MEFLYPALILNSQGKTRVVGFEVEFAGLSLDRAAAIVTDLFGGRVQKQKSWLREILRGLLFCPWERRPERSPFPEDRSAPSGYRSGRFYPGKAFRMSACSSIPS
ncbi:MAG: hypothetical protein C4576_21195 [Desulfobacteraceae bacterium]|nr:MAG: hypothetical protein C4576_21195 [Desulfobacteraceae bacterium]